MSITKHVHLITMVMAALRNSISGLGQAVRILALKTPRLARLSAGKKQKSK
jgi:hypothetical protein